MGTSSYPPAQQAPYSPLQDDLEAASRAEHSSAEYEDEPAWARPPAKRRRWDWRTGLGGLALGVVLGWGAFAGHGRYRAAQENKSEESLLSSLAPSSPLNSTELFDVPVRINYRGESGLNGREPILKPECPVPVVYTADENVADIIVFNTDSHRGESLEELEDRRRKRPWQKTAVWGVESAPNRRLLEDHFNKLRDGKANETSEYSMTYRLNSTVPATYSYAYLSYDNPPVPVRQKRAGKIAAALISNCHPRNARTLILQELSRLLPGKIDSFGTCEKNANLDETLREMGLYDAVGTHTRWNEKITLIGHYRFTIAFENSNDLDYVTEKCFQALERGSVPLVFGAPNYARRIFPSPNAGIDLAGYLPAEYSQQSNSSSEAPSELSEEAKEGLARLAKRLDYLSSEKGTAEYEKMLAWKKSDWKTDPENPLGKIVRESTHKFSQDCRLALAFRGQPTSRWTEPVEKEKA
ncbi:hypothetical protein JCM8547_004505 [Rhodosporidiobolus lusitaniae]